MGSSIKPEGGKPCAPPVAFVLDVDGVMTDGKSIYTAEGKVMKVFGPDDHDALALLRPLLDVHFVSADRRGFPITRARIERDMGFPLDLVSASERLAWIGERWPSERTIYMGDGFYDRFVLDAVGYGIAVRDADADAREAADFVTQRSGGDRAVAEACKHVLDVFYGGARAHMDRGYSEKATLAMSQRSEHDAA